MPSFERKSMEQLTQDMVDWTRGVTTKLSDFRVGSKIRTIYEATALITEELYDKVYQNTKILIEEAVYSVMGFSKLPAINATGLVTFGRATPADTNYLIPAGTLIRTKTTATTAPIEFRTTIDALLPIGGTSVDVLVACQLAGTIGNVQSASITEFTTKPSGVETVTNASAIINGLEEETKDQQRARFQKFIGALARGHLFAVEYGATTASVLDSGGNVTERVVTAKAFEDTVTKVGQVDVYIWNGVSAASASLLSEVTKVINGYYDTAGAPVYGYKSAGIKLNVFTATPSSVALRLTVTAATGLTVNDLKPTLEQEIDAYFGSLQLGQNLIYSEMFARLKNINGVADIKVEFSTNGGTTWIQSNIVPTSTAVFIATKPIVYL